MRNSFVNIALFVGIAVFNLSVLCQSHCAGIDLNAIQVRAAADAVSLPICAGQSSTGDERGSSGSGLYDKTDASRCVAAPMSAGVNTDIRLSSLSVEVAPRDGSTSAVYQAYAVFSGARPAPSERPPWPLA